MIRRVVALVLVCMCAVLISNAQADTIYTRQPALKYLKQSIAPVSLIGLGVFMKLNKIGFNDLTVKDNVVSTYPNFHTNADDYLRFASLPFIYGLDLIGVKAKTDIKNRTAILIKAEVLMCVSVKLLKNGTDVIRPDGSNNHSFPSGHTAQAFLGAAMIQREYGQKSIWYPVAAYTVATSVGVLRVLNNRHYTSDVFVGAGIGMLSVHIAYWTHQYKWNKNVIVMPTYSNRAVGVYFAMTF